MNSMQQTGNAYIDLLTLTDTTSKFIKEPTTKILKQAPVNR